MLAQSQPNPYSDIAQRNVFGLKPPPVFHAPTPEPPPRPTPNLLLTGVVDFSTSKWALITRTDPGRPPSNYTLTPGEIEGGLQLLDINATRATVTVRVDGMDTIVLHLSSTNQAPKSPVPPQISALGRTPLPVRR
jgi:hypothetical protein